MSPLLVGTHTPRNISEKKRDFRVREAWRRLGDRKWGAGRGGLAKTKACPSQPGPWGQRGPARGEGAEDSQVA